MSYSTCKAISSSEAKLVTRELITSHRTKTSVAQPKQGSRGLARATHKLHSARSSLAANHLVLVEFASQERQRGLDDATTQPQHQVEGRLCMAPHALTHLVGRSILRPSENHRLPIFEVTPWCMSCAIGSEKAEDSFACESCARITLLNVVVRQSAAILKLLAGENETLLVRGDACDTQGGDEPHILCTRTPTAV